MNQHENLEKCCNKTLVKKANIMILPFMMESGIDELYALPKNFGAIQYLSPNNNDSTMVSYTDKLEFIGVCIKVFKIAATTVATADKNK